MRMLSLFFLKKDNILLELEKLKMQQREKKKLVDVLDELVEYRLVNMIMSKLEKRDKELFIEQLYAGSAEIFIEFLREKIENCEQVLGQYSKELEAEILEDIESLQKNK